MDVDTHLLIAQLRDNPDRLFDISPGRFEELIAQVLRGFGFEVSLTPGAKESERDIVALRRTEVGNILTLVECKRFPPGKKLGIRDLSSLLESVDREKASNGIIVTTGCFTSPANRFLQEHRNRLIGVDGNSLQDWLNRYVHGVAPDDLVMMPGEHELPRTTSAALPLYFSLSEFNAHEVCAILSRLSSLYDSVGGDGLVIEDMTVLDSSEVLDPTGA